MNISHEEYLKQFQQSKLLAEQKTNLYGPFNTVPMGMPGGNPNIQNGTLQITVNSNYDPSIAWCITSSEFTTATIDWGNGTVEEIEMDGQYCFGYTYDVDGIWNVTITFEDPSLITDLDFND